MRILLLFLAFLFAAASISSRAEAQYYPWCAIYSGLGPGASCGYATFAQCMASVRGLGGFASKIRNPRQPPQQGIRLGEITGTTPILIDIPQIERILQPTVWSGQMAMFAATCRTLSLERRFVSDRRDNYRGPCYRSDGAQRTSWLGAGGNSQGSLSVWPSGFV